MRADRDAARVTPCLAAVERGLDDPRDRALVHEAVLGVVRRLASIDRAIAAASSRPVERLEPRVRAALRLGVHAILFLDRVPVFAAVDSSVEIVKRTAGARVAGFVNAVLRRVATERDSWMPRVPARGDLEGLAAFHDFPLWWVSRRVERLGWDRADRLLEASNRAAPTVLRANLLKGDAIDLAERLRGEGIETEPSPVVPEALRVLVGAPQRTQTFREGRAYIQDEAAQLVASLMAVERGGLVVDVCAAPGGKSLQWACDPGFGGMILALDRSATRLRTLTDNVGRMGASGIFAVAADARRYPPPVSRGADAVLVDAPCTATGTLRRHPEIRWRLAPHDPARASDRQLGLLRSAAGVVAPRGRLVYAVCSLEEEEGRQVAERFLAACPEFDVDREIGRFLPEVAKGWVGPDGSLRTDPGESGTDGFFAVAWVRSAR